jgi:hypothetical protein
MSQSRTPGYEPSRWIECLNLLRHRYVARGLIPYHYRGCVTWRWTDRSHCAQARMPTELSIPHLVHPETLLPLHLFHLFDGEGFIE